MTDNRPNIGFMSVDVEEWFTVLNFQNAIPASDWDTFQLRAEGPILKLLDLFDEHQITGTFFALGWLLKRAPELFREIHRRGHEVACHGFSHSPITKLSKAQFDKELLDSLQAFEDVGLPRPIGFRAPSFSITQQTMWATDSLQAHGFVYDSSIFPVGFHPDYGIPDSPLEPYQLPSGLIEFPLSVVDVAGRRLPCSGGGYFRLLPYSVTRWLINRARQVQRPVNFYLHPWELDPDQPRMDTGSRTKNFRHYVGLQHTEAKLRRLCSEFRFTSFAAYLQDPARQPTVSH
jgi:polysaccharide deacetylase family protein (PEP-CTERM system associated)